MGFKTVDKMPPMRRRSGGPRSPFTIEVQAALSESTRTGKPVELDARYPTTAEQQKIGFRYRAVAAKLGMGLSLAFTNDGYPVLFAKAKGTPVPEVVADPEPEPIEVEFTEPGEPAIETPQPNKGGRRKGGS